MSTSNQAEVDAAWNTEIGLRIEAVLTGAVELEPFETTRTKARAALDEVRG
jgi:hypothetical protein